MSADLAGAGPVPLFVDLDGTVLATDSLHEGLIRAVIRRPWLLFRLPGWIAAGKAEFKRRVADAADLDPGTLPYRAEVVELLRAERARGRKIVLATGAPRAVAERVADHLGVFDEVLATDDGTNLTGAAKLDAIVRSAGAGGFDYIGNSRVDLPIWAKARQALTVDLAPAVARSLDGGTPVTEVVPRRGLQLATLLRGLRVHQWSKNLLLFVPLFTSHLFREPDKVLVAATGFLAFSFLASAIYLINDLVDLPSDRTHRTKRNRPLAAGQMKISTAVVMVAPLVAASALLALQLSPLFVAMLGAYLVTTTAYSFRLKRIVALDSVVLASLYALRIEAGAAAIAVEVSPWLLAFSIFIFLSLALVKRASELVVMSPDEGEDVEGRGYRRGDLAAVAGLGAASAYTAVLVFALYVNGSNEVAQLYSRPTLLYLICPLLLYWVSRIWILTLRGVVLEDPVVFAIKDRVSYLVVGLTAAITLLAT